MTRFNYGSKERSRKAQHEPTIIEPEKERDPLKVPPNVMRRPISLPPMQRIKES